MPAFTPSEILWSRIDVHALITGPGLATVEDSHRDACLSWLQSENYQVQKIDCSQGMQKFIEQFRVMFPWVAQFGYELSVERRSLDAIRDGFYVEFPASGRVVLEFYRPDLLHAEDPHWLIGLIAIASEHSRFQLACGKRFFSLIVVPKNSDLIGRCFGNVFVPRSFWTPEKGISDHAGDP